MNIQGTIIKFLRRNEKTGFSRFTLRNSKGGIINCEGVLQPYPKGTPLNIVGEYKNEENIFVVKNINACAYSYDIAELFLTGGYYEGIGETVSHKIINAFGESDYFKVLRDKNEEDRTLKINGVSSKTIDSFIRKTKNIIDFENLIDFIYSCGGEYFNAGKLYKKYSNNAIKMIKENPYVLLYGGADFSVCEKMAKNYDFIDCDKRRIKSIVNYAMQLERNNGHTKVSFKNLCKKIHDIEKKSDSYFYTNPLFIGEEILTDSYVIDENKEDDIYVYTKTDFDNEEIIVNCINRLISSKTTLNNSISIEEIESMCEVKYSKEQKEAFNVLKDTGIKIITGGPGTGKTTVLNGILKKYEIDNPYKEVLLCAPTGCAARHMSESTQKEAFTIHKTLGIRPFENGEFDSVNKKLTADCVVIDESSMIDTEIMAKLLSSIKNGALVILLGDQDQLPSIGAGNVLKDLIDSKIIPCTHFSEIFRQNKDNPIIQNSRKVSKGIDSLTVDKKFKIKNFNNEKDMIDYALYLGRYCEEKGIKETNFYTPVRNKKFLSGTINMNKQLQDIKHHTGNCVSFGFFDFYKGDKVIFNTNNYEAGYYNGQEGIIIDVQEHNNNQYITVLTDNGRINLSGGDIDDIELGYIMTAHKAQGGECKNAVILVPQNPPSLLKRQLLYVEITRAKESVIILSEKDAIKKAISDKYEYTRETGLKEKLVNKGGLL